MKTVIIVCEDRIKTFLAAELDIYAKDVEKRGWKVEKVITTKEMDFFDVKDAIKPLIPIKTEKSDEIAIFLVGHVKLPKAYIYSRPDGHGKYGVSHADWFYGDFTDLEPWPVKYFNKSKVLDGAFTPNLPNCSVGRVDAYKIDKLDEIVALRFYFGKLHDHEVKMWTPVETLPNALLAYSYPGTSRESYPKSILEGLFSSENVTAVNAEGMNTPIEIKAFEYTVGYVTPATIRSVTNEIKAKLLWHYRSFDWLNFSYNHTRANEIDGPRLRGLMLTNSDTLATIWRQDKINLNPGVSIGEALRTASGNHHVSLSLNGAPTTELY